MTESELQAEIFRAIGSRPHCRLFRNNTGQGWVGQFIRREGEYTVLRNARPLQAGLFKGSADLIGWDAGRFLSIEVKGPSGIPGPEQIIWRDNVLRAGGIAGIVRSVDEALALIS